MNRPTSEGSVALGAVAARAEWLAIACRKCERKGRLRLAGLLERYGPDYPMTQLRRDLAGDCPEGGAKGTRSSMGVLAICWRLIASP
jgi:hypothetical protein